MAVEHVNVIEAMGLFTVDPNGAPANVLAEVNASAGFNPVGVYNGVGDYRVLLSEPRLPALPFLQPQGVIVGAITITVTPGGGGAHFDILVVGDLGAVELPAFSLMVYNLPGGL